MVWSQCLLSVLSVVSVFVVAGVVTMTILWSQCLLSVVSVFVVVGVVTMTTMVSVFVVAGVVTMTILWSQCLLSVVSVFVVVGVVTCLLFVVSVFVVVGVVTMTSMGESPMMMFVVCFTAISLFYVAHWQTFVSGKDRWPPAELSCLVRQGPD